MGLRGTRAFCFEDVNHRGAIYTSPRVNGGVDEGIRFEVFVSGMLPVTLILPEDAAADMARLLERQLVELEELRQTGGR